MDGGLHERVNFTDLDLASIFIATCVHDFQHFGVNNAYLVESKHELALWYNDISVLENHHIGASFKLMVKEETAIFENFSTEHFKEIWKKMIEMVLATDMQKHFTDIAKFKSWSTAEDFAPAEGDKSFCMQIMIHLADLNNATKPFEVSRLWTGLLYDEFLKQGDMEKAQNLPIGMLNDRETINIAKS